MDAREETFLSAYAMLKKEDTYFFQSVDRVPRNCFCFGQVEHKHEGKKAKHAGGRIGSSRFEIVGATMETRQLCLRRFLALCLQREQCWPVGRLESYIAMQWQLVRLHTEYTQPHIRTCPHRRQHRRPKTAAS